MIYSSANERAREMQSHSSLPPTRMATVVSTSAAGTIVRFDGEDVASGKPYKRCSSYTPAVGDRVVMLRVNASYVIEGAVIA